jgi:hypothetical protein
LSRIGCSRGIVDSDPKIAPKNPTGRLPCGSKRP